MAKYFEIIMAGIISGIVALTTSYLGIGGTVLGAALGAIIYQIISILVKEPLEKKTIRQIENDVVYILPLILIAILLIIFIMQYFNYEFLVYYNLLKEFTDNNLLRLMGLGLIIMGIYPLIQSKSIDRKYGIIVLFLGIVLLLRGLIDINVKVQSHYSLFIGPYDFIILSVILLALLYVIFKIFLESVKLYKNRDESSLDREIDTIKKLRNASGPIKSSKTTTISKNKDIFSNIKYNKSEDDDSKDDNSQDKNDNNQDNQDNSQDKDDNIQDNVDNNKD